VKKYLTVVFVIVSICASAQTKFGFKAGLNSSNIKQTFDGEKHLRTFIPRLQIGTIIEIPLNESWLIHTGPYYSGKGCRFGNTLHTKNDSTRIHLNYIELPVQIMYQIDKFKIGAGPYIAYGFKGKILYKGSPEQTIVNLHKPDAYYKRWDFGYSIEGVYQINEKFGIKSGLSHSLINTYQRGNKTHKAKNMVLGIAFYAFVGNN
jgi:hypothetical protein